MRRNVTITCNGSLIADSRSREYGIMEGTLKLGIDDVVPQLDFTISETQAGYSNCILGGDVKVYFDDVLKFRGVLNEIDIDSNGNRTVVAYGDIWRLNRVHDSAGAEQIQKFSDTFDKVVSMYNEYCPDGPSFTVNYVFRDDDPGYSDKVYSYDGSATCLEILKTAADAANDGRVHYWVEPSEGDTCVLTVASTIEIYAGEYVNAGYIHFEPEGYKRIMRNSKIEINTQSLRYGVNLTDINVEHTVPDGTVYNVSCTDYWGNEVSVAGLEYAPCVFYWNGTPWNSISMTPQAPQNVPEYGFIYETADCGQIVYESTRAPYEAYYAAMKILGVNLEAKTITASGVDMHYINGNEEEISPYKPIYLISEKHDVNQLFMINSIEYDLLDQTKTDVSVGGQEALITR